VGSHLEIARMRRQAEDARRRSDQRIRSILESITDAFFALDRDWRFTYVNRQAEHLLGRGRDDLVGKHLWEEYPAALGTDFEVYYRRAMDENVTVNFETYYPPHERWYDVHAYPSPEGLAVYFRDANERRRAAEALRDSEARFRAVVESNMVGIGFWRSDGTITDANDTLLAMIGRTRAEVASGAIKYPDITPPQYHAVDERAVQEIAELGSCVPFEKEFLRPDGSRIPVVLGAARLPHDPTRGPFFALDIGDRKSAELALREATATLRSFYDTSPVMMGVVEVGEDDIRHLTDNAATGRFFGVDPATLAGRCASELGVPLSYRLEWIRRYRESERTRQPVRFDYPHDLPEGRRWVSAIVYCIESLPGGRSRCSYVAEDVTDRKNVEGALHRQSERLRLLWEAATVMLTTEDPDAMLRDLFARIAPELSLDTYFNFLVDEAGDALHLASCAGITDDQARAISRLEFGQAICGTVAQTRQPIVATHIQQSDDPIVQLVRGFGVRSYACSPLLVEGRLYGTLSFASRGRDEFGAEDLDFLRTVSHYVTVACERIRLVRQLRDQDRRKDEFLATLAHELRNPLAPIRTGLQVLRLTGDADDRRLALEMMERQLGQMVRLIDDLLDISRITRNRLELRKARIPLASVIENAVETARPLIDSRGHTLLVKLPDEPVDLDADLTRLAQVFWNLLNNSAKYTDPGGRIELTARRRGDEVIVTVSDDGIGIPTESLPGLFTMFSQVEQGRDRAQGGLGIGLALVKGLVEMHGGRVEASSPGIGRGSTFTVHLPALPAREPAANGTPTPGRPRSGRRRVLIVDDNRDGAASLGMMLSLHGHDTRTAHDGPEAIELAEAFRPDLMLLDIGLPRMSGYDVCRRIRGEPWGRSIVIVAVTGWGQDEDRRRSQEVGFDQHLLKPIEFPALEKLLASLSPSSSARPS
ncbi:MAG: hybrid sensor histidine kinase/response regulator, partial [Isosphaeraceae bacterium]